MYDIKLSVRGIELRGIPNAVQDATRNNVRVEVEGFHPVNCKVVLRGKPKDVIELLSSWKKDSLVEEIREELAA